MRKEGIGEGKEGGREEEWREECGLTRTTHARSHARNMRVGAGRGGRGRVVAGWPDNWHVISTWTHNLWHITLQFAFSSEIKVVPQRLASPSSVPFPLQSPCPSSPLLSYTSNFPHLSSPDQHPRSISREAEQAESEPKVHVLSYRWDDSAQADDERYEK